MEVKQGGIRVIMRDTWNKSKRNHHYEVNEDGYVRNSRNNYILTNSPNNKGYMTVSLGKHMPGQLVHILVAETFIPEYEPGLDVDHKNGKKWDNRVENLQCISRTDNVKRAFETGLAHGHKGPNAGTPPRKVQIIETGEVFSSISECARAIGGSAGAICQCVNQKKEKYRNMHFKCVE